LTVAFDGGHPEAELIVIEVTFATFAVTLDEGSGTEIHETRASTRQRLAASFSS